MNQIRSSGLPDHLPLGLGGAFGSLTIASIAWAIPIDIIAEAAREPITKVLEKLNDSGGGKVVIVVYEVHFLVAGETFHILGRLPNALFPNMHCVFTNQEPPNFLM